MKTIEMTLDESSIAKAIDSLRAWEQDVQSKVPEFLRLLAQEGVDLANIKFWIAQYDGTKDVSVTFETRDEHTVAVVATGNSVLFIEFGTGVVYPDDHPEAAKNGMIRGEYGHGLGKLESGWRYTGDPGTNGEVITDGVHAGEIHTYGNPSNMCMYYTVRELKDKFEEIARRVFA